MTDRSVKVALSADVAAFERAMAQAAKAAEKLVDATGKSSKQTQTLGQDIAKAAQSDAWSGTTKAITGVGVAAGAAATLAVKSFADFDQQMSAVRATGQEARDSYDALKDAAIQAGADTAFSAGEAARGMEALLKAGVEVEDVLSGGLTGSLALAAAGEMDLAAAAETASSAMVQFKLAGQDVGAISDALAAGAGKAMGDVSDLAMALKQGGLVASQFGLGMEETVGTLSAFASAGLLGSDAGTSFKTMLLRLADPSKEARTTMESLGVAAYDAQGQFVGLAALAEQLKVGMQDLAPEQRQQALATIFGTDAIRAAAVLYEQGAAGVDKWTAAVSESGYAAEVAATRQDNLYGDLEKLGGSIETLLITAGESANGPLRGLVQQLDALVDAAGRNPEAITEVMTAIAGLAGVGLAVGGIMKATTAWANYQEALAKVGVEAPRTSAAISSLAKGAVQLGVAFTAMQIVGAVLDEFREAPASIDAVAASLTRAAKGAELTGDAFRTISGGSLDWQGVENFGDAFQRVTRDTNNWTTAVDNVDQMLSDLFGRESGVDRLAGQFEQVDQALSAMDGAQAAAAFAQIRDASEAANVPVGKLLEQFPQYAAQIDKLAAAQGLAKLEGNLLADAMEGLYPPMQAATLATQEYDRATAAAYARDQALGRSVEDTGVALLTAAQAAANTAQGMDEAGTSIEDMGKYLSALEARALGAKYALDDLNAASRAAGSTGQSLFDAQTSVAAALVAATEAAKENGRTIDANTEKGRNNRQALSGLVSGYKGVTEAMIANGDEVDVVNAKITAQRAEFLKTAGSMGVTGKAAEDLADEMGLIPNQVSTLIVAENVNLSREQVEDLNNALEGLPDEVRSKIATVAQRDGYNAAWAMLRELDGKTATTYIKQVIRTENLVAAGNYQRDSMRYQADGGYIRGPGTTTSDSIPAMLSDREYVLRAWATDRIGVDRLEYMNRTGRLPHFADGGHVLASPYSTTSTVNTTSSTVSGGLTIHNLNLPAVTDSRGFFDDLERIAAQHGVSLAPTGRPH